MSDKSLKISITSTGQVSPDCVDKYKFATVAQMLRPAIKEEGTYDIIFSQPSDVSSGEAYDWNTKGVRVFNWIHDEATTVANIAETALLFIPEFTKPVDPISAERNVDFMARYAQFSMEKRDPSSSVPPEEHLVHSGKHWLLYSSVCYSVV